MGSKLLLNICCGPCAIPVVDYLKNRCALQDVSLYFYAPNLYPAEEFTRRLEAASRVAAFYGVELITGPHEHEAWLEYLNNNLSRHPREYPENGARCLACFAFRIDRSIACAKACGFNQFGMTLSVSRHKDTGFINTYSEMSAAGSRINYVRFELDPVRAHQLGTEIAKKNSIYRQKYCGCEFSLNRGSSPE